METNTPEKDVMKEAKQYASLSTRLPNIDAVRYILFCKKLGTNTSERLRQLIISDLKKPIKRVVAGVNKIRYDKIHNSFNWSVQLDSGQETEILNNLSGDFLKNLQNELQEAIKERNEWVHQSHPNSVEIPNELTGGKNE